MCELCNTKTWDTEPLNRINLRKKLADSSYSSHSGLEIGYCPDTNTFHLIAFSEMDELEMDESISIITHCPNCGRKLSVCDLDVTLEELREEEEYEINQTENEILKSVTLTAISDDYISPKEYKYRIKRQKGFTYMEQCLIGRTGPWFRTSMNCLDLIADAKFNCVPITDWSNLELNAEVWVKNERNASWKKRSFAGNTTIHETAGVKTYPKGYDSYSYPEDGPLETWSFALFCNGYSWISDEDWEKLKDGLFEDGKGALESFLICELPDNYDKNVVSAQLDDMLTEISSGELQNYCARYDI